MPLGNLIEKVQALVELSREKINNLPEVHMSSAFRQALRAFLLQNHNGAACKDHFFQVETSPHHWTLCSTQYLYLASISHDCALVLKKYFDFLDDNISNDPNMVSLINDLQEEFKDRTKKFDDATEALLEEVNTWLIGHNCTAYTAHCNQNPSDQSSLCFFLAAFGVKSFKNDNSFRPTKDLFKSYILSIMPVQSESTGFEGYFIYYLTKDPDFYEQLTKIVNQNPMGTSATSPLQLIMFGAPGTGKSFKIDDSENGYGLENVTDDFKFRTTFHPDYDYAQFVGAYKPIKASNTPILNKSQLLRELKIFKEIHRPNAIHKFAACYFESLKKLTAAEEKQLFDDAGIVPSVQIAEVPKAISVGSFFDAEKKTSSITYTFVPQVFAKAYVKAWIEFLIATEQNQNATGENVYLVIEEINRGNCAQIFGDIFQLLDRDKGHSSYPINIDSDFAEYIKEQLSKVTLADNRIINYWNRYKLFIQKWAEPNNETIVISDSDENFCKIALPPNLNILATMNTSDQSLFPMDSAFKRRFDWEYVAIDYAHPNADFDIEVGDKKYKWLDFLEKVNKNIFKVTKSEDKQMGEFFIKHSVDYKEFRSKVLFYLWDSVYKDEEGNKDAEKVFHFKLEGNQDKTLTFQTLFEGSEVDQKDRIAKIMSNLDVVDQNAPPPPQQGEQGANAAAAEPAPAEEPNPAQ